MQHSKTTNDQWGTPPAYIEAARKVMGGIDIDPASNDQAQELVQASRYYTKENSGLDVPWYGNVWLNPPYSRDIKHFIQKLDIELTKGNINQAIVLTNNGTDTRWFQMLAEHGSAFCFHRGRIAFLRDGIPSNNNNKGQIITYIGHSPREFKAAFAKYGVVV